MKKIHITTGDIDGIGLEVSAKALYDMGPINGVQFILWRKTGSRQEVLNIVDRRFQRVRVKNLKELNKIPEKENIFLDMASSLSPTQWVVESANNCFHQKNQSLVTGPLSKTQMQKDGFFERGHTELLKKISNVKHVFMFFLGNSFNVALLTGHLPLKQVKWGFESLKKCIHLCQNFQTLLPSSQRKKKIAILGFNPHAGEEGLIGKEDLILFSQLKKISNKVVGPLIPDVAFLKKNWKEFSTYICLYHDQGLIPFKMIHKTKSSQMSLGLPFVRTSVSHGTAKDIFGKNKADCQSMKEALKWALKIPS